MFFKPLSPASGHKRSHHEEHEEHEEPKVIKGLTALAREA
jgi:hypothetical protein